MSNRSMRMPRMAERRNPRRLLDGLDDLRARGFLLHEIADDFYALCTGDGR